MSPYGSVTPELRHFQLWNITLMHLHSTLAVNLTRPWRDIGERIHADNRSVLHVPSGGVRQFMHRASEQAVARGASTVPPSSSAFSREQRQYLHCLQFSHVFDEGLLRTADCVEVNTHLHGSYLFAKCLV